MRLWYFCHEYLAELISLLANYRFELQGGTPYEAVMQYTQDISEYVSFKWFQLFWYFEEGSCSKYLCHWIGPAHHVRQSFFSYLTIDNGEYIERLSVITIPKFNFPSLEMKETMQTFMQSLKSRIGNYQQPLYDATKTNATYYSLFDDDIEDEDVDLLYKYELIDFKGDELFS